MTYETNNIVLANGWSQHHRALGLGDGDLFKDSVLVAHFLGYVRWYLHNGEWLSTQGLSHRPAMAASTIIKALSGRSVRRSHTICWTVQIASCTPPCCHNKSVDLLQSVMGVGMLTRIWKVATPVDTVS